MQEAIAEVVPAEPTASSRKRGRDHVADADSTFNDRYSRLGDGRRVEARLSSQIGAVNGSRRQRDEQIPESTKPEIQQVYQQAEILNRNRRLFGSLMGHLGQARQKLEQDTEKIERQSQRVQEIKEKSERGAKLLEEEQRRKAHQEQVEVKIEAVSRLTEDWKRHNSTSRGLLDRRNDEIQRKIAERELSDSQQVRQIQLQAKLHSNSRDDGESGNEEELHRISSQDHETSDNESASRNDCS